MKTLLSIVALLGLGWLGVALLHFIPTHEGADAPDAVARGRYLVTVGGCGDCHTPWHVGPNGPEPDASRLLAGHPAELAIAEAPARLDGPWLVAAAATNTAWAGPWGVSFTANLTPDEQTGIGTWDEATFVATLRNGRHMGLGRTLLPPMPRAYAAMTESDLRAMYAYLRTVPAVRNAVPAPLAPASRP